MGEQKIEDVVENETENEQAEPDYGEVVDSPKPIVQASSDADVGVPVVKLGEGDKPTTREIVDNANKAISDIESGSNIDIGMVQKRCDPNMKHLMELQHKMIEEDYQNYREQQRREFIELVNRTNKAMEHSLSNAEEVGGTPLMSELIERTNSNAWLDASPLRLRHVDGGEGDENVVELFDSATNKVIHSLRFPKADSRRTKK
ncbi:MAG: hypothetical protein K2W95_33995 [Candidatus Obscuribacterales bacterium]|nr:hypothetical protein [Candidatus Obscuribacterales bacterium]